MTVTLSTTAKTQSKKEIIDKLDVVKILNFCSEKDIKKMRKQATDLEKIFAKGTYDKGLLSKIYKELLKLSNKKINNPIKNRPKTLADTSPKRYTDG